MHPETNFNIPGGDHCEARFEGAELRGFFEVDTGEALQFTHELSGFDEAVPAVKSEALTTFDDDRLEAAWVRQDYEAVLAQVRPAAEAGEARALNMLGLMYLYGYGVPKSRSEGTKWIGQGRIF